MFALILAQPEPPPSITTHLCTVMSTNRKTKKYDILEKQSGVSLLVHDFSEGDSRELTGEYSITLNGNCSVIRDGGLSSQCPFARTCLRFDKSYTKLTTHIIFKSILHMYIFFSLLVESAERYRAAHLRNNPDYPQVRYFVSSRLNSFIVVSTSNRHPTDERFKFCPTSVHYRG